MNSLIYLIPWRKAKRNLAKSKLTAHFLREKDEPKPGTVEGGGGNWLECIHSRDSFAWVVHFQPKEGGDLRKASDSFEVKFVSFESGARLRWLLECHERCC
ncbi:hypothetical protein pipiens_011100 [Culex pipiens pipiens]|uniref:Uncharacterized protein n=1 Tax=Culex pipiens pipiens TaxID=38569 RepID=A0ABD1D7N2_CULPP